MDEYLHLVAFDSAMASSSSSCAVAIIIAAVDCDGLLHDIHIDIDAIQCIPESWELINWRTDR